MSFILFSVVLTIFFIALLSKLFVTSLLVIKDKLTNEQCYILPTLSFSGGFSTDNKTSISIRKEWPTAA